MWYKISVLKRVLQIKKFETNTLVPTLIMFGVENRNLNISRWTVIMHKDITPIFYDIFAFLKEVN